jgi:catechol 2,3-dioxygenase-like lactoylglutathione lyase family enzyme
VRLDHVQVAAPEGCEEAARAFFVGRLGFVALPKPEGLAGNGGAWFSVGDAQVHVGVEADFRPARKAHLGFDLGSVEALEALFEKLDGGRWDTQQAGVHRFFADDPWGNRLEFFARP